jgi:hypothetical protein
LRRWANCPEFGQQKSCSKQRYRLRQQVPIWDLSKNRAFPAIRVGVLQVNPEKSADFGHSPSFLTVFGVKANYFIFVKKHGLKARPEAFRNNRSGRESASGG